MNEQEYKALMSIIQRTPMNDAEVLAMQMILEKLRPKPPEEQKA